MEKSNRIREALSIRGMKQVDLAEKTGISRGTINNWLNNKYQPKQKSLLMLARALEVSELWLAGYDVPMERPVEQIKIDELAQLIQKLRKSEKLNSLCNEISKLNDNQLTAIELIVKELSSQSKECK